jgi:protein-S-isoprenylcysteine O-methyltransferase Ste14
MARPARKGVPSPARHARIHMVSSPVFSPRFFLMAPSLVGVVVLIVVILIWAAVYICDRTLPADVHLPVKLVIGAIGSVPDRAAPIAPTVDGASPRSRPAAA